MTPEILLLVVGTLGISGLAGGWWWTRRALTQHVIRIQTAWVRAGQIVHYGPVGGVCLGNRPRRAYGSGVFGGLGITDGRLVFDGYRSNTENISVPYAHVRHIGLTAVAVRRASRRALTVHYESPDGWRVATFLTDSPVELAQALADECDLPVYDSGEAREDFGPAQAVRMFEDVYGEWHDDREDDLYLAPDRLLFGWRDAILLADIRRLDVYAQGGRWRDVNPLARDLLRIEHGPAEDDVEVVGFGVRGADQWADAIRQRATAPLAVYVGRKRKKG
jgi:hypothetical protein